MCASCCSRCACAPDSTFAQIRVSATHTYDAGDKIAFTCKGFTPTVSSLDTTAAAWKMTWSAPVFTDCTKVVTGPGGFIGLIVAIVQSSVLCVLGPTIMLYGPSFPRFTYLVKAIVVSSYLLLINSIISANAFTAFLVFERFVTFFISTMTVTYTSVNNPVAGARAAGFALGALIAGPFTEFLSDILYKSVVGCKGVGEKREWFPNGEPTGCDLHSATFQGIFHGMSFLKWLIIIGCAYYGKKVVNFSTATVGASMVVKGIIDLTKAIGFQVDPDQAAQLLTILTPVRAWVTYGVAAAAFLAQRMILTAEEVPVPEGSPEGTKPTSKMVVKQPQGPLGKAFCGILITICAKIDGFLQRNLETLKDGGKAALKRGLTRTFTKSNAKVAPKPAEKKKPDEVTAVEPVAKEEVGKDDAPADDAKKDDAPADDAKKDDAKKDAAAPAPAPAPAPAAAAP